MRTGQVAERATCVLPGRLRTARVSQEKQTVVAPRRRIGIVLRSCAALAGRAWFAPDLVHNRKLRQASNSPIAMTLCVYSGAPKTRSAAQEEDCTFVQVGAEALLVPSARPAKLPLTTEVVLIADQMIRYSCRSS